MAHGPMTVAEQSAHYLTRRSDGRPAGPVEGDAAWYGPDLGDPDDWADRFSDAAITAFEREMTRVQAAGRTLADLGPDDVDLSDIAGEIEGWRRNVLHGRGVQLIRGAPVARWTLAEQTLFTGLLGLQFGRLGLQNPQGDLIGQVKDTGADKRDPFARKYATSGEFLIHCDAADLLGLLCVRPAAEGGESKVASSVTVYNELLRRRPDLAALMFGPIKLDLRNEQAPGTQPWAETVPCAYAEGRLRTFYISDYFRTVDRHPGAAKTAAEAELLDLYDALATSPEIALSYHLRPGDVQILNNHFTLHARTAFTDPPGAPGRLLLRFLASVGA